MEKIKILVFTLTLFMININNAYGACDFTVSNELNKLASNVKVSYEVVEVELEPGTYAPPDSVISEGNEDYVGTTEVFRVYIENMREELYVDVYSDLSDKTTTYTYPDAKDGTIYFDFYDINVVNNLTFTIYSSENTTCPDTKLFTNFLTLPRYNLFSEYGICDDIPEFYLCKRYLTIEYIEDDVAADLANEYKKSKQKAEENKDSDDSPETPKNFLDYINEYKWILIGSLGAIVIITVTVIVIVKKRRRRSVL